MSVSIKQFNQSTPRPTLAQALSRAATWVGQAWLVFTTRRELAQLDDHAMADLGISRAQAHFEAERPFWALHSMLR